MRNCRTPAVMLCLVLLASAAFANGYGSENLIKNGGFDGGLDNWAYNGVTAYDAANGRHDPGSATGPYNNSSGPSSGALWQFVDTTAASGWASGAATMDWKLSSWVNTTSDASVVFELSWWRDYAGDLEPSWTGAPGPDGSVSLPVETGNGDSGKWRKQTFSGEWDFQPRWVRVSCLFTNPPRSGPSWTDDVDFQIRSQGTGVVPEQSALLALATGIVGVVGFLRRMRRR